MKIVSRERFIAWLANELGLDASDASKPFLQLGLDSLQMFEIDLMVEELGVTIPEEILATCESLDDVYRAYTESATAAMLDP